MLKVPVEEAPRNSFATRHETMNSCRSPSFCCPFFFRIALQQISEPVLPSNRFSGGELEVTRRIRLGVYCVNAVDNSCRIILRHAYITLIFKSKPVGPKMPSSFRFPVRASHRCGSEPIEWLAGISSRKLTAVLPVMVLSSSVFMLFLVCLSEQVRIGVIVLEDSTMMGKSSYRT